VEKQSNEAARSLFFRRITRYTLGGQRFKGPEEGQSWEGQQEHDMSEQANDLTFLVQQKKEWGEILTGFERSK